MQEYRPFVIDNLGSSVITGLALQLSTKTTNGEKDKPDDTTPVTEDNDDDPGV